VGLLRAVRSFGTRSGPGRGHGIGIMAAPEFISSAMPTSWCPDSGASRACTAR